MDSKTADVINPDEDPYGEIDCPVTACQGKMYMEWSGARVLSWGDDTAMLADPRSAYSSSWKIGCTEGHVLLLPESHAGDTEEFGEECYLCSPDEGASNISVPHPDMERLRATLHA